MSPLSSFWCDGAIRHRRLKPIQHEFTYSLGMLAVNLDDWDRLNTVSRWFSTQRFNWLTLRRQDYFAPDQGDLKAAIADHVYQSLGWKPDGAIELITVPRYLGLVFNPVSFYFCYQKDHAVGSVPAVIVAQITNTPWLGRHTYCLELSDSARTRNRESVSEPVLSASSVPEPQWQAFKFSFEKRFHVSPFNALQQQYEWLFAFRGDDLRIHMEVNQDNGKAFDATLTLHREPLTPASFTTFIHRFPLESFKVVAGIYWQALRLKLKGARFHSHPDKQDDAGSADTKNNVSNSPGPENASNDKSGSRPVAQSSKASGKVTSCRN